MTTTIVIPDFAEDMNVDRVAEYSHLDGVIRVNPTRFYALPELMQWFVLLHEEAHAERVPNPDFKRDEGLEMECDGVAAAKLWQAGVAPEDIMDAVEASDILTEERKGAVRALFVSGFGKKRKDAVWAEIHNVFGGKEGYDALARDVQKAIESQVDYMDVRSNLWSITKLRDEAAKIALPYAQAMAAGSDKTIDIDAINQDFEARKESSSILYVVLGLAVVAVLVVTFFVMKKRGVM